MRALMIAAIVASFPISASAKSFWQDPVVTSCEIAPGENCVVDAKCPSWQNFAVLPAFEVTKIEPNDARVGLLSMVPLESTSWRITWRNNGDVPAKVETSVRLRCGKTKDWGQ